MKLTLVHGDALKILPKLKNEKIDLVLTDPPYGIGIAKDGYVGSNKGILAPLKNYNPQKWDLEPPKKELFDWILKISNHAIIFGGNCLSDRLPVGICWFVWDKQIPKGFKQSQMELMWTNIKTYPRIYSILWNGMFRINDEKIYHPTQKPLYLIKEILMEFSHEKDLILDSFLGSGTTMKACLELNRNCIGIEIDKKYIDITKKRLNWGSSLNPDIEFEYIEDDSGI